MKVIADNRRKIKENEKIDKYLDLAREPKKAVEHEGDSKQQKKNKRK